METNELVQVRTIEEVNGQEKTAANMTIRELEQVVREWDKAKKLLHYAQSEHERLVKALEKTERALRKQKECTQIYEKAYDSEIGERKKLQAEIKELKARPVEVAVERDEAALQELEEERDKALEEIDALRRSLAEADTKHMEADAAREVLSRQMELARARIRELESGGPEGVDTRPMKLRLFVDEARDCVNRALGVLFHLCDKEDQTDAYEARAALMELAEYIREAAA